VVKKIVGLLLILGLFGSISCAATEQTSDRANQVPGTPSIDASWAQSYGSIDELIADSFVNLIAVGEIDSVIEVTKKKEAENSRGPVYVYSTDFSFRIDRVLKGPDTKQVSIHQTGAEGEGEIDQDPLFKPGERSVLFLHEYAPGKYYVVGGPAGRYRIVDDKVYSMNYVLPPRTYFPNAGLDTNGILRTDFIQSVIEKINAR
jgi:hypothetical protein